MQTQFDPDFDPNNGGSRIPTPSDLGLPQQGTDNDLTASDYLEIAKYVMDGVKFLFEWRQRKRAEEKEMQEKALANTLAAIDTNTMTVSEAFKSLADVFEVSVQQLPQEVKNLVIQTSQKNATVFTYNDLGNQGIYQVEELLRNGVFDGYVITDTTVNNRKFLIYASGLVPIWTKPMLTDGSPNYINERGFLANYTYLLPSLQLPKVGRDEEINTLPLTSWTAETSNRVMAIGAKPPTGKTFEEKGEDFKDEKTTIEKVAESKYTTYALQFGLPIVLVFGKTIISKIKKLFK